MFRIDADGVASVLPAFGPAGTAGFFQAGNAATGQLPTEIDEDWLNGVQEELVAVLTLAGISPSKGNTTQLAQALRAASVVADVGAQNAMVVNPAVAFVGGAVAGTKLCVIPAYSNTGATTLNYASEGAVNVLRPDGTAAQAGDILAMQPLWLIKWGGVWLMAVWPRTRIVLGANLNLYVSNSGQDAPGNGLTSGTPFLTLQYALDFLQARYDLGSYNAIIHLANGTYAGAMSQFALAIPGGSWTKGTGLVSVVGNPASPSSVVLTNNPTWNCAFGIGGMGAAVYLTGVTPQNPSGVGMTCGVGAQLVFDKVNFAACAGAHIECDVNGTVANLALGDLSSGKLTEPAPAGSYTISGGATRHLSAYAGGIIQISGAAVTLSGTPAFSSQFAYATASGLIYAVGTGWTGSATGTRFTADTGGGIACGGASASLPGNAAGTATSPGWAN